jgi:hypothetical protein
VRGEGERDETYALGALVGISLADDGRAVDGEGRARGNVDDPVGSGLEVAGVLALNVAGLEMTRRSVSERGEYGERDLP